MADIPNNFGFLDQAAVARIAAHPTYRLTPLLVRCGGGRFTCPAQDVAHFIGLVERQPGGDYVRDVSIPVGVLLPVSVIVGLPGGWARES